MEHSLGFDRIRELLASYATNGLAQRMIGELSFMTDYDAVCQALDRTSEMCDIMTLSDGFPSQDYIDMSDTLSRLHVEGSSLTCEELLALRLSLQTIVDLLHFFRRSEKGQDSVSDMDKPQYPHLFRLATPITVDEKLVKWLSRLVDDRGELYDDASDELLAIRRKMSRKRAEVDIQVSRALARAKNEGWAPAGAEPTIRNGRPVIPMLDTHRRKMKGIIHDESASRQTAFVEPADVVELNNDLRQLQFDEHHEVQRILMHVADDLRPQLTQLTDAYRFLAAVDFTRAKARLALQLHAVRPVVDPTPHINWVDARHPLLQLTLDEKNERPVVPFNLQLDGQHRILIVSGPNAGGKSVLLKAVGLLQYMLQCGLLVTAHESSEWGIFGNIFIDIGDQQSIDDDLSTYTSHLRNMKRLLEVARSDTLFLLDELGGGTEPRSGCAIASALLEELCRKASVGVVTTHFADLKKLADDYESIENGAMLFDTQMMRPLYRLRVGLPGSSFAFEIARNVGFPQPLLDRAAERVGDAMLNFEQQLQQLEADKEELARRQNEVQLADNFLAEVIEKYQKLNSKLEEKRYDIVSKARNEARKILDDANRTVERTISEIRTAQAERKQTLAARQKLREKEVQLQQQQQHHDEQIAKVKKASPVALAAVQSSDSSTDDLVDAPVSVGMVVRIDGEQTYGQVVEIKGNRAVVESNSLRMTISLDRLSATLKRTLPREKTLRTESRFQTIYDDINEKRKSFSPTADIRGQRAEEALDNLQHFFDDARLLSEHELRILHGKGYGILKQVVREWLHQQPDVVDYHAERLELGGDGITVVHLR